MGGSLQCPMLGEPGESGVRCCPRAPLLAQGRPPKELLGSSPMGQGHRPLVRQTPEYTVGVHWWTGWSLSSRSFQPDGQPVEPRPAAGPRGESKLGRVCLRGVRREGAVGMRLVGRGTGSHEGRQFERCI